MLILNEFDSHMIFKFWTYIMLNKIVLFKLSAHFTHLTQSLDVRLFQFFKHYHVKVIDAVIKAENVNFNKLNILTCFQIIQIKAFTKVNILSTWRNTNLIFYNSQIVIFKFQTTQFMNQSVTSLFSFEIFTQTFSTIRKLIQYEEKLLKTFKKLFLVNEQLQL